MIKFAAYSLVLVLTVASCTRAEYDLNQLMTVCEPENKGQLDASQMEFVYDKLMHTFEDLAEFKENVEESRDLFHANMNESNKDLRARFLDNHTIRVCVIYSMVKNVLDNEGQV